MLSIRTYAAAALPLMLAATAVTATPALASDRRGGGGGVRASGSCSAASDWTLKAKHDDGRIEVEFEVDSNHAGQTWNWRLSDNGTRVAAGTAQTTAPSGSFTVHRRIANRAGTDVVRFRATNPRSNETCTGSVRV